MENQLREPDEMRRDAADMAEEFRQRPKERFTPGPWKHRHNPVATHSKRYIETSDKIIAEIQDEYWARGHNKVCFEARHNANLIATAPELYTKLNQVSDVLEHYDNDLMVKDILEEIRYLLKKARGES